MKNYTVVVPVDVEFLEGRADVHVAVLSEPACRLVGGATSLGWCGIPAADVLDGLRAPRALRRLSYSLRCPWRGGGGGGAGARPRRRPRRSAAARRGAAGRRAPCIRGGGAGAARVVPRGHGHSARALIDERLWPEGNVAREEWRES
ncbi:hypothetical protein EJB05_55829, partial [Eragrostis curvula]